MCCFPPSALRNASTCVALCEKSWCALRGTLGKAVARRMWPHIQIRTTVPPQLPPSTPGCGAAVPRPCVSFFSVVTVTAAMCIDAHFASALFVLDACDAVVLCCGLCLFLAVVGHCGFGLLLVVVLPCTAKRRGRSRSPVPPPHQTRRTARNRRMCEQNGHERLRESKDYISGGRRNESGAVDSVRSDKENALAERYPDTSIRFPRARTPPLHPPSTLFAFPHQTRRAA